MNNNKCRKWIEDKSKIKIRYGMKRRNEIKIKSGINNRYKSIK